jgi:heat shock protein HtpX
MIGTLALIIGISTLFFTAILSVLNIFDMLTLSILVGSFNILQWLMSPYLINTIYQTREVSKEENPELYELAERLSLKSGIKKPSLVIAKLKIPNAFAYGSPITGNRIAVTDGLLNTLEYEELEAVLGHEFGHLKHRDVQIMMFVSLLPALLYYIGYSFMLSSMYDRRREGNFGSLFGVGFLVFSWVLNIFILYLSRLREYYADKYTASVVDEGARKLSEGLAKIVHTTKNMRRTRREMQQLNALKALFIADPDQAEVDSLAISQFSSADSRLVQEIISQKLTTIDRIVEVFSSHPNIVKRLKALQEPI